VDWQGLNQELETATRDWRLVAGQHRGATRLRWDEGAPQGIDSADWSTGLQRVGQALQALSQGLDQVTELAPDFVRLHERSQSLRQLCERFVSPADEDAVRWAEVSAGLRVVQAPLDVAETFMRLTAPPPASDDGQVAAAVATTGGRAWVFTSATLGDEPSLRWFTGPCGLGSARTLRVESPFDYAQQAALYVPEGMSPPVSASMRSMWDAWCSMRRGALAGARWC